MAAKIPGTKKTPKSSSSPSRVSQISGPAPPTLNPALIVEGLNQIKATFHDVLESVNYTLIELYIDYYRDQNPPTLDPDQVDSQGRTPLVVAISKGTPEIVKLVLELKPRVNKRLEDGKIALHHAGIIGSLEIFRLLIRHNSRRRVSDNSGHQPFDYILLHGDGAAIRALSSIGFVFHNVSPDKFKKYCVDYYGGRMAYRQVVLNHVRNGATDRKMKMPDRPMDLIRRYL